MSTCCHYNYQQHSRQSHTFFVFPFFPPFLSLLHFFPRSDPLPSTLFAVCELESCFPLPLSLRTQCIPHYRFSLSLQKQNFAKF